MAPRAVRRVTGTAVCTGSVLLYNIIKYEISASFLMFHITSDSLVNS